ncbi:MAG: hypothetical protein JSU94_09935, partial [Phycisphaerales bacterium]
MARVFGFKLKEQRSGGSHNNSNLDNGCLEEISGLSNLYSPEEDASFHVRDIADVLSETQKISAEQLSEIRREQKKRPGADIAEIIGALELADETAIATARANLYGFEFRRIEPEQIDRAAFGRLDLDYIKNNHIMPIAVHDETLVVATSSPADLFIIEDVKRQTHMNLETVVCLDNDIERACEALDDDKVEYDLDGLISDMTEVEVVQDEQEDSEDLEKMAG